MTQIPSMPEKPVVALFNASDDTYEMVQRMLDTLGLNCIVGCHMAELRKHYISFGRYLAEYEPQVVIFDIDAPFEENWHLFGTLLHDKAMEGRGVVLTTTNKQLLDKTIGESSRVLELVGKPYDLNEIKLAIEAALKRAQKAAPPPG
jgi:hypothetical protein